MNTKLKFLILFIFIFSNGCENEITSIDKKISLTSVTLSGCTAGKKSFNSEIPSISIHGHMDDNLLISINNTELCCGTDSIAIDKRNVDNKFTFEIIDMGPFTHCYCPHDLEFSIGPFKNENYELTFIESEHSYVRDTFVINFIYNQNLDTTITSMTN